MNKLRVKLLKGERWYGGSVQLSILTPLRRNRIYYLNDKRNKLYNQSAPLFISNKGRVVYSEVGFSTMLVGNYIIFNSKHNGEISIFTSEDKTLRGGYLIAKEKCFVKSDFMPAIEKFSHPQYCTWVELIDNQNQDDIVDYAKSIIDSGMPVGELILDDGWQSDFGDWEFDPVRFKNPTEMIKQLKDLGFKVSLWICPFVSYDVKDIKYLIDNNLLVRDKNGEIAKRKWWNGRSYVLDLSNPKAKEYFSNILQGLMDKYGIEGFKQDAGDALYYRDDDITYGKVSANDQSVLYAEIGYNFAFNELRACWKLSGSGIAQRLADKWHRWFAITGLRSLIPNMLNLGMIGHPFSCADMVGGGFEFDFNKPEEKYDHELFIRSTQCSALLPMIQFSKSIWRLKNKNTSEQVVKSIRIRDKYQEYINEQAYLSKETREPIVRYVEYNFADDNAYKYRQQFMLGDKYLVAPVTKKGAKYKVVYLPKGKWKNMLDDKIITSTGEKYKISVDLSSLPIFEYIA